jgi:multiple sugar transport system permease protein
VEQVAARARPGEHEAPLGGASSRTRLPRPLLDRESFLGPVMILPAVLYVIALVGFPFCLSIYLALSDA